VLQTAFATAGKFAAQIFHFAAYSFLRSSLFRGAPMYNNYLSCEVCGTELTRANQKQQIDKAGFMHSFCQKCYAEKFPK
jgi:hypothetical protein